MLRSIAKSLLARTGYEIRRSRYLARGGAPGWIADVEFKDQKFQYFVDSDNDAIQRELLSGRLYEPEEIEIILQHTPTGRVFVDVGANVGTHAITVARLTEVSKVIAFEPNPRAASLCDINIRLNELGHRVELRPVALSDRAGEGQLVQEQDHNLGGAALADGVKGGIRVQLERGDDVLIGEDIGFIKIDVERHEEATLAGLAKTIARCRPVVFIEVFDDRRAAILHWLDEAGYAICDSYRRYEDIDNLLVAPVELADHIGSVPAGRFSKPLQAPSGS